MTIIDTKNHRILIVDDDNNIRDLLGSTVEAFCPDASIDYASSRFEAEQKLDINPYTHVLTDMTMEGQYSGIFVARFAKDKNPKTRVFLHTGSHDKSITNKLAAEPSIDRYALKPNSTLEAANFVYTEL
ncbi:response regulator [archaeon]|jgi:DNA-binding NtrC family response regulator|nr:response regulator [archaeon]MBT3731086.1 response regulator [archaeon]MBT4670199.1 response regulator [archaeon]MBT5030511.1 response regulator [archaeon]MBT5287864.1 response regulator [archaeon]